MTFEGFKRFDEALLFQGIIITDLTVSECSRFDVEMDYWRLECTECKRDLFCNPKDADQGRGGSTVKDGFCSLTCSLEFFDMYMTEDGEILNKY